MKTKKRSIEAYHAFNRTGAGQHKDKKKENNKNICRNKINKNEKED